MAILRKPTQLLRVTVSQELQPILLAEEGVPEGAYRKVTIFTPQSPVIHLTLDTGGVPSPPSANSKNPATTPLKVGPNRDYKTPPLSVDASLSFCLLPQQQVFAQAEQGGGFAVLAVLVEYMEGSV